MVRCTVDIVTSTNCYFLFVIAVDGIENFNTGMEIPTVLE